MRAFRLKPALGEGRPIFGMVVFTLAPAVIEILGASGFDFIFLDAEHTPLAADDRLEHLVRAADSVGLAVVVRVKGNDEHAIRNALEMGAEGVVIPRLKTRAEAEAAVRAARFPPAGGRGAATEVRAARYGAGDFDWSRYVDAQNRDTLVIGLAEDKEFFDAIDDVMAVEGLDMVCFGPTDLALSMGLRLVYQMDAPPIQAAFRTLTAKAREHGKEVMSLAIPATAGEARKLIAAGVRAILLRSDVAVFERVCRDMRERVIDPARLGA